MHEAVNECSHSHGIPEDIRPDGEGLCLISRRRLLLPQGEACEDETCCLQLEGDVASVVDHEKRMRRRRSGSGASLAHRVAWPRRATYSWAVAKTTSGWSAIGTWFHGPRPSASIAADRRRLPPTSPLNSQDPGSAWRSRHPALCP